MNTLFIGQNSIELNSIDSTNTYAIDLVKNENVAEGTIVWTKNQTKGRGQRGNNWESKPFKNLAFSLVLKPSFLGVEHQFYLNKIVSVAVADFVSHVLGEKANNVKIRIKWPNDIYIDNCKVAGILIENAVRNNQIVNAVAGIGININQENFGEGILNPTSLKLIAKQDFDIDNCLQQLCSFLEVGYLQLKSLKFDKMEQQYRKLLYRYGEWADYKKDGKNLKAKITGISNEGKLILETLDNKQLICGLKEVEFVF